MLRRTIADTYPILLMFAFLVGCKTPKTGLRVAAERFNHAWVKGDVDTMWAMYSQNIKSANPNGLNELKQQLSIGPKAESVSILSEQTTDERGTVRVRVTGHDEDGYPFTEEEEQTFVKQNGVWVCETQKLAK